ncbi:hypothetical protein IV102_36090 [bacterium]|nr:hypothetical protein [bacterium]
MKIGSWLFSSGATSKGSTGRSVPASALSQDRLSRDGTGELGLGNGFSLGTDGKVVSKSFWGKARACSCGESIDALAQAYQQGQISAEELKTCRHYPNTSLLILGERPQVLQDKLKTWPEADQAKFEQLLTSVGTGHCDQGENSFFLGSALEKLALQDKLTGQKDQSGLSLLDNLVEMQKLCQADGATGSDLFAWTLVHSAYSKRTFHQVPGKGICGAATLGYVLWQESPARVVRALRDWAYEGQAQTRSGPAERPQRAYDPSQAAPLADQVLQASLMNLADPQFAYDIVQDQFSKAGEQRERGLFPEHQQHLLNSLSTHDWQSQSVSSAHLQPLLKQGSGPIPVALEWTQIGDLHSRHMLTVNRVTDQHVYLRDPAGELGLTLENSTQEKLGEGFLRMSRQEFDQRIQQGLLPDSKA